MMKFGGLRTLKTLLPQTEAPPPLVAENPLEFDEELFGERDASRGARNEALRKLLAVANTKINELDAIKSAVSKLVEPVDEALRVVETEEAEKRALQSALNESRAAFSRLRNEHTTLEQKFAEADGERRTLHQEIAVALGELRKAQTAKTEIAIDVTALRAKITELEARLASGASERKTLAEQCCRLVERVRAAEKRAMALESELDGARQRLERAEEEKRAQQTRIECAGNESAELSRKLAETEASLEAARNRLRRVETADIKLTNERNRLAAILEETKERLGHELAGQRTRFEALQARALAGERLLGEAREHLITRAEQMSAKERRLGEIAVERDCLQARLSEIEAERVSRESTMQALEEERNELREGAAALSRTIAGKDAALRRAEETIEMLNERLGALEYSTSNAQRNAESTIEELQASLRREEMTRLVVEGALDTARKDFSRVTRELMALQRVQQAAEPTCEPVAANAA